MQFNEHDPKYGAFMLNLDDFECRQQRKFSRKLSRLRTDAVLFFAKLKLKAQAKKQHWDDNDIRWELNAVESRMQPRVRPRQLPTWDGYMTVYSDVCVVEEEEPREHIPSKRKTPEDDFNQRYKTLTEKLATEQPVSEEELRAAIEAFVRCMRAKGHGTEATLIMMDELFAGMAEQIQSQKDPKPTADRAR